MDTHFSTDVDTHFPEFLTVFRGHPVLDLKMIGVKLSLRPENQTQNHVILFIFNGLPWSDPLSKDGDRATGAGEEEVSGVDLD